MSKLTKNQKSVADKIEAGKIYTLNEASKLVKEITTTKFDASLDIDVRLGVDPRKANQMVRGVVSLMEPVRLFAYFVFALPMWRMLLRKPVLTMLVLTSISRRSKVVGLTLT